MAKPATRPAPASTRPVDGLIHVIREQKVMLDHDLAALYGVPTKAFNQAVRRNIARFPEDFMFQLSPEEEALMRSQFVTASKKNIKVQSLAFTEHGVAMLASVLKSARAVEMSITLVRTFVRMRELMANNAAIAARVEKLEQRHDRTASVIEILVEDIDQLAHTVKTIKALPKPRKQPIGFALRKKS
ncbi:MAG: ORF6N domain-containing protein [Rickettsiales bacterium]